MQRPGEQDCSSVNLSPQFFFEWCKWMPYDENNPHKINLTEYNPPERGLISSDLTFYHTSLGERMTKYFLSFFTGLTIISTCLLWKSLDQVWGLVNSLSPNTTVVVRVGGRNTISWFVKWASS